MVICTIQTTSLPPSTKSTNKTPLGPELPNRSVLVTARSDPLGPSNHTYPPVIQNLGLPDSPGTAIKPPSGLTICGLPAFNGANLESCHIFFPLVVVCTPTNQPPVVCPFFYFYFRAWRKLGFEALGEDAMSERSMQI